MDPSFWAFMGVVVTGIISLITLWKTSKVKSETTEIKNKQIVNQAITEGIIEKTHGLVNSQSEEMKVLIRESGRREGEDKQKKKDGKE